MTKHNVSTSAAISIEELTAQPLPIFGHSARAFRKIDLEGGRAFEGYGDIILRDPGLALRTLKQLQEGSKKPLRTEISSMAQATMLLGIDRAKRLPLGHPQLESTLTGYAQQGYVRAASRAFHAAFQAWDWAHIKNDHAPEEVLLAALLHDVAEMALWVVAPDKMHQFRKLMLKDGLPTDEAQYIAFGESLEHFSREIADRWQLPGLVGEALRPENANNSRVQGVMLAVQLARCTERGWYWEKAERLIPQIADYLGTATDEVITHVHKNAIRAAHEAPFYGARHAAALLPMLPGGDELIIEDEFPESKAEIEAGIAPVKATSPEAAKQASAQNLEKTATSTVKTSPKEAGLDTAHAQVCLTPQADLFKSALRELYQGIGTLDFSELMRKAVHCMHDGIGLNRAVFARINKHPDKLVASYCIGSDNDPSFSRFEISLDQSHLFTRLLEKQVSLWITDDNREKFWPLVPNDFKVLIKTNTFFVMSVHVGGKPVGLFYADRRSTDCKLDENAYKQFRQVCQLVAKGLANLTK